MSEYIAHQESLGEFTLKIIHDEDAFNPRTEYDGHLGKMVCWHRNYNLGDEQPRESPSVYLGYLAGEAVKARDWELIPDEHIQRILNKHFIILPLYLYDHSGITISTGPFGCPWDSGQVGFIYVSVEDAKKEFSGEDWKERTIETLRNEVKEYDNYLTGNCYGYVIENGDGEQVDSCWGFLGDYDGYILQEARERLNYYYTNTPLQLPLPTMEELEHV